MVKYICKNCGKSFKQKGHYINHMNKKVPCNNINNLIIEKVEEEVQKILPQFSELSKTITKNLCKEIKKKEGIFFTPHNIIKKSVELVIDYCNSENIKNDDILEPSCGSCEYIKYINTRLNNTNIDGIEYNDFIFDSIKNIDFGSNNKIKLIHENYLKYEVDKKYNIIFGNPPYYVIKKTDVNKEYHKYYDGRPNIFIIFIIHSLFKLNKNGILCFILPNSFCNCLYYNKLRIFIKNNYKIINIIDCSNEKYLDTSQNTIIFIIQNIKDIKNNKNYIYDNNGIVLFNTPKNIKLIKELYKNTTTLKKLNFNVKVGNIVWNQCKDILTDDNKYTRLIYSSDIKNKKLELTKYKEPTKKNYIKKDGYKNPIMVVNRGYGTGTYDFNHYIIDINEEYLIENHLIVIEYNKKIKKEELLEKFKQIENSFNNDKTKEFIKLYCCNSALNTTELKSVLPIYLN